MLIHLVTLVIIPVYALLKWQIWVDILISIHYHEEVVCSIINFANFLLSLCSKDKFASILKKVEGAEDFFLILQT
jgi:hypothetical protein